MLSIFLNCTFITCLFRFVLKVSLNIFTEITEHYITKYYLLNLIHEIVYFYFSLRNTCVFDTFPLSAFDMRRYFGVFIKLTVIRYSILGYFVGSLCFSTEM